MSRNQFRLLVAAGWLFSLGSMTILSFESSSLPLELQDYVKSAGGAVYDPPVVLLQSLPFVAGVVASAGLLLFKRWARTLYTLTFALGLLLLPTLPPAVMTPWASLFSALAWLAISSMMVLMYLPPVKGYFERKKADFS